MEIRVLPANVNIGPVDEETGEFVFPITVYASDSPFGTVAIGPMGEEQWTMFQGYVADPKGFSEQKRQEEAAREKLLIPPPGTVPPPRPRMDIPRGRR